MIPDRHFIDHGARGARVGHCGANSPIWLCTILPAARCTSSCRYIFTSSSSTDFPMAKLCVSNRDCWDRVRSRWSNFCSFRFAIGPCHVMPRSPGTYGLKLAGSRLNRESPVCHIQPPCLTNLLSPPAQDLTRDGCRSVPPLKPCLTLIIAASQPAAAHPAGLPSPSASMRVARL